MNNWKYLIFSVGRRHIALPDFQAAANASQRVCSVPEVDTTAMEMIGDQISEKLEISCSADSLVVAESLVLRINISGKNPAHRKSAKRYASCGATANLNICARNEQSKSGDAKNQSELESN